MIERCAYCGLVHDVGGEESYFGMAVKTCPMMPQGEATFVRPLTEQLDDILNAEVIE